MTDPTNLKTLAQFLLLGDPSVVACAATKQYSATKGIAAAASPADEVSQRKARRVVLASAGLSIAGAKAVTQKKGRVSPTVRARVLAIAKERGLGDGTPTMLGVRAAPNYAAASKARALKEGVMVVSKRKEAPNGIIVVRHLVAHIVDKGIASVVEVVSR